MIGRLIERLFVEVRADMSDLSRDLNQGMAQTRSATRSMALSWGQVSSQVELMTQKLDRGKITQGQYTSEMNRLSGVMKTVAGSYRQAQSEVWGYAAAARAAQQAVVPAFDTRPVASFTRSAGQARMQMMNLGYQLNDVGMTLATGMNPLTVMIQQGSQILQIYAGQGGLRQAFSDISRILLGIGQRVWPLAVLAAGFKGLQSEINKTTDVSVSFMDTFKATFQVLYSYIQGPLSTAFKFIGDLWAEVWTNIVAFVRDKGNQIIRAVAIVIAGVKNFTSNIPDYFRAAFSAAVAAVLSKLHDMLWYIDNFAKQAAAVLNEVFGTDLKVTGLDKTIKALSDASGDYAIAARESLANATDGLAEEVQRILGTDYMGDLFNQIRDQAIENALSRIADGVEDVGGAASRAAEEVKDMVDSLQEGLVTAADNLAGVFGSAFERLAETGRLTFGDFVKDLNQLIIRSTSEILQQELSNMFQKLATSKGGLGSMLSNLFTGLFGGGNMFGLGKRARGGVEMPWRNFIAGEEGAELINQDGPSGARRVMTAGQTRHAMQRGGRSANPNVTMIIQTPDVDSFQKSQSQIASRMGMMIARGQRNQ